MGLSSRCRERVTSPPDTMSTWGLVGMYELLSSRLVGKHACGSHAGGLVRNFRAGWAASRPCYCQNASGQWLNCEGRQRGVSVEGREAVSE